MYQTLKRLYHRFSSPKHFYQLTGAMLPWFVWASVILLSVGLGWGLLFAPPDYQQGDSYRIIYIHVPSASLGMSVYVMMAIAGAVALIWRMKIAEMVLKCCAPIGLAFTVAALATGSLWGKPTWGTYWEWDARLTSMLILAFLYVGVMALGSAIQNQQQAARAMAVLALVGVVNIPIIKYSVEWWNTLHQSASVTVTGKSSIDPSMLPPFLISIFAFYCFFAVVLMMSTRVEILRREQNSRWVQDLVNKTG